MVATGPKPIETKYDGHRFRSRLEARWAVFFNALGVVYEYEKEGFELDGLRYLPDFWLPEHDAWVEIKGQAPTETDLLKGALLGVATEQDVLMFVGQITIPTSGDDPMPGYSVIFDRDGTPTCDSDEPPMLWTECPFCRSIGLTYSGLASGLACGHMARVMTPIPASPYPFSIDTAPFNEEHEDTALGAWLYGKAWTLDQCGNTPRLVSAYRAARQARFEFGEAG